MEKTDFEILPVIRKYVTLKKRGINYVGLCPFHEEKTPSFTVSEVKNVFKCFGCGKGGNTIQFLMEVEEISFGDALEKLNNEFRIPSEAKKEIEIQLNEILEEFNQHVASVNNLMNFDRFLLDFCIQSIKRLDERIRNNDQIKITNARFLPTNTIKALENVQSNDSLRNQYESIFNQCLVLLVSYFSSICKELFRKSVDFISIHESNFFSSIKEDIKLSFAEISEYEYNLSGNLGRIIIDKKNISFQDMQSIERSFNKYLLIESNEISKDVNNIILAQASRHCIVHASEIADEKFMYQIRNADDRNVLKSVKINEKISISTKEIEIIADSMHSYLKSKITSILSKIN